MYSRKGKFATIIRKAFDIEEVEVKEDDTEMVATFKVDTHNIQVVLRDNSINFHLSKEASNLFQDQIDFATLKLYKGFIQ